MHPEDTLEMDAAVSLFGLAQSMNEMLIEDMKKRIHKVTTPEFDRFDATVRKVLSVSRDELKRRERAWKRKRAAKKRAKTLPASRASSVKH